LGVLTADEFLDVEMSAVDAVEIGAGAGAGIATAASVEGGAISGASAGIDCGGGGATTRGTAELTGMGAFGGSAAIARHDHVTINRKLTA
jgi:hypothetical protein